MSVYNLITGMTLVDGLKYPGHIHFFTKDIALEILRRNGYNILDYFYTGWFERPCTLISDKIMKYPRKIVYKLNNDFGIRLFGGLSFLILTK